MKWEQAEQFSETVYEILTIGYRIYGNSTLVFAATLMALEKLMENAPKDEQQPMSFLIVKSAVSNCIADMKLSCTDENI